MVCSCMSAIISQKTKTAHTQGGASPVHFRLHFFARKTALRGSGSATLTLYGYANSMALIARLSVELGGCNGRREPYGEGGHHVQRLS